MARYPLSVSLGRILQTITNPSKSNIGAQAMRLARLYARVSTSDTISYDCYVARAFVYTRRWLRPMPLPCTAF